jgi:general secretion pathway protein J
VSQRKFNLFAWYQDELSAQEEQGFALLEMIVALTIMALVGLMAWRGMDAMIRGRETIDRRANQDADYSQVVRQFERDCQEVLQRDELSALAGAVSFASASSGVGITAVAAGAKNIWLIRHYRADAQDAWMVVGYGMGSNGLQRWTSRPLLQRTEAVGVWSNIVRDPDLNSSELLTSLEIPAIVRQTFRVQSSVLSGAGGSGISASGTNAPNAANATSTSVNNSVSTNNSTTSSVVVSLIPEQQGIAMQWWIQNIPLPITRSCLMGGAL